MEFIYKLQNLSIQTRELTISCSKEVKGNLVTLTQKDKTRKWYWKGIFAMKKYSV
jgi:hypothetical protein